MIEIIHSDVWSNLKAASLFGDLYFVSCIEDSTRYAYVRAVPPKEADIVVSFLQECIARLENIQVRTIRSDSGGA